MRFKDFLNENENTFSARTTAFINKWTTGSTRAIMHAFPDVKRELKTTVTENKYLVFRGWKFADEDALSDVFGTSDLSVGKEYSITLSSWHSWTTDKKEATNFSNPRFDGLEKQWFDDDDISNLGYDYGDLLGIGVLVEAVLPRELVVADLSNLSDFSAYEDEKEIVSGSGTFTVKVIDIKKYLFSEEGEENEEVDDFDWDAHNKSAEHENALMTAAIASINFALSKAGYKETEEDIIKFLNNEKTDKFPIAAVFTFAQKFPKVHSFLSDNYGGKWSETYEHFNLSMVLTLSKSMNKNEI